MSAAMTRALPVIYICILAGMVTTSFPCAFLGYLNGFVSIGFARFGFAY